jgi:hypothetical protein
MVILMTTRTKMTITEMKTEQARTERLRRCMVHVAMLYSKLQYEEHKMIDGFRNAFLIHDKYVCLVQHEHQAHHLEREEKTNVA